MQRMLHGLRAGDNLPMPNLNGGRWREWTKGRSVVPQCNAFRGNVFLPPNASLVTESPRQRRRLPASHGARPQEPVRRRDQAVHRE